NIIIHAVWHIDFAKQKIRRDIKHTGNADDVSLPNLSVSPRRNLLSVLSAVPICTASSACVIFVDFIKSFMRSRMVPGKKT
ncbi:MAG: hypothetical protein SPJ23_08900, partial [Eubacteriales bacterium]|nr:hypothetical protein [Eubacteriales bacterium]